MTDFIASASFAEAIALQSDWPRCDPVNLSLKAHARFAASYLQASERCLLNQDDVEHPFEFYLGPTVQLAGLSAELTLKALLRGSGFNESRLKKLGHSTYRAYCEATKLFDEVKFVALVADNCSNHLPASVRERLDEHFGDNWPNGWNVFIPQIRSLDAAYDKPYRSRYHEAGRVHYPEAYVVVLGIKTLLAAMLERLGEDRLPGSMTTPI